MLEKSVKFSHLWNIEMENSVKLAIFNATVHYKPAIMMIYTA